MKRLLIVLIIIPAIVFTIFITKQERNKKCYIGEESKTTFTYSKLITPPLQTFEDYPIICENRGMFDFSSIAIYEANEIWIDTIKEQYHLHHKHTNSELYALINNLRYKQLTHIVDIISNDHWLYFSGGCINGEKDNNKFKAHFDMHINNAKNRVIFHYHSFSSEK